MNNIFKVTFMNEKIKYLLDSGVVINNPDSVDIGADVDVKRISNQDVVIFPGTRLYGERLFISKGAIIGSEGPAHVDNCFIGPEADLKSGFFKDATFLKGSSPGSNSHVRGGTIMEEFSKTGHSVGLKQTILFPYSALGSLINFCDCLMSGGTGPNDHSEVGSSYIHFNFTPNQDKATPSLFGDVALGVMLNQRPIFLGGQGGIVGPVKIAFGTVTGAGSIIRKNALKENRLIFESVPKSGNIIYQHGIYRSIKRLILNNFTYIANLLALLQWYEEIRAMFVSDDYPELLHEGLLFTLNSAIDERIKRLRQLKDKMPESIEAYRSAAGSAASENLIAQKMEFIEKWDELEIRMFDLKKFKGDNSISDIFKAGIAESIKMNGTAYIPVIHGLSQELAKTGSDWLIDIVDVSLDKMITSIQSFA